MPSTTMGMSTSDARIKLTPKTSDPKTSKVISNNAHGASMEPRGNPAGWATYKGSVNTKMAMMSEEYGKGGGSSTANMNPKGPKPKGL